MRSAACSGEYEANFLVGDDLSRGDALTREATKVKNATVEIRQCVSGYNRGAGYE